MASKTYSIPYDRQTKSWEPVTVSAQVRNQGDKKIQRLTSQVLVEDAATSAYSAMTNNVLLLEGTEIEPQIGAGDIARIKMRLNDNDSRLIRILQQNSRFKLKVTLTPELAKVGEPSKPGPPVEAVTEIYAELPQVWDLTFRKTLWEDAGVIDLTAVEGVPKEQLQALGDWGGTLVLQPKGRFIDSETKETIASKVTIEHARECVLDRGDGKLLTGEWDPAKGGYVFEIEASQKGDGGDLGGQELTVSPPIEPHQGWQRQLRVLLASARKIGRELAPDVPQLARTYIEGCLDHLAVKTDEELAERRTELAIWILNTSHFIEFMENATEMFNKALNLFDEAFKRFLDNMVNFAIELVFALFDVMDVVFKSASQNAKTALKGSTKEMVEEVSERAARELIQQRDLVEQGVRTSREGLSQLDNQIADVWRRFPADTSNPTPELLRQMDTITREASTLTQQRQQLFRQFTAQKKELVDLEANLIITREIKENAGEATEEAFLETIKERATALPENPQIRQLMSEVEQMGSRDASQYMNWQAQVQQALRDLPPDAPAETRSSLQRLSAALGQYTQALQTETLIDLNQNVLGDQLAKGPLGNRLKEVNERAQKAKTAAEGIRYENVAWEHYKGFFSPLWWFMDWSLAQILWLYDLAREWIPGLALAESLLATAVDTVLHYVMSILNAMIDFMNSHQWRRSCINSEVRGRGQTTAMNNGIHGAFFDFPKSTAQLPQMLQPRRIVSMGQNGSPAAMQAVKQRILTQASGGYQQEKSSQRNQARIAFAGLCRGALDASRLELPAPEQLSSGTIRGVWSQLVGPMVKYEQAFTATGAQATDYLWSIGHFAQNSTFQDWDGAIEWLAWAVAWGLRLGGVLAVFTGVGAAAVPAAFAAAQGAEWIGAVLRPAVSWLGTMPDIIAFQYDVVIAAGVAYEAATSGSVSLDNVVVASEYVE